jgi:hypothetical protein
MGLKLTEDLKVELQPSRKVCNPDDVDAIECSLESSEERQLMQAVEHIDHVLGVRPNDDPHEYKANLNISEVVRVIKELSGSVPHGASGKNLRALGAVRRHPYDEFKPEAGQNEVGVKDDLQSSTPTKISADQGKEATEEAGLQHGELSRSYGEEEVEQADAGAQENSMQEGMSSYDFENYGSGSQDAEYRSLEEDEISGEWLKHSRGDDHVQKEAHEVQAGQQFNGRKRPRNSPHE